MWVSFSAFTPTTNKPAVTTEQDRGQAAEPDAQDGCFEARPARARQRWRPGAGMSDRDERSPAQPRADSRRADEHGADQSECTECAQHAENRAGTAGNTSGDPDCQSRAVHATGPKSAVTMSVRRPAPQRLERMPRLSTVIAKEKNAQQCCSAATRRVSSSEDVVGELDAQRAIGCGAASRARSSIACHSVSRSPSRLVRACTQSECHRAWSRA